MNTLFVVSYTLLAVIVIAFTALAYLTIRAVFYPDKYKIAPEHINKLFAALIIEIIGLSLSIAGFPLFLAKIYPNTPPSAPESKIQVIPAPEPKIQVIGCEDLKSYEKRLDKSVVENFDEAIRNFELTPTGLVNGEVLSTHYSWIIGRQVVVVLVDYSIKDFEGDFKVRTKASGRKNDTIIACFEGDIDKKEKLRFSEQINRPNKTTIRVVKLAVFNERVLNGNFLYMRKNTGTSGVGGKFTFDVSIVSDLVRAPQPVLHDVGLPFVTDSNTLNSIVLTPSSLRRLEGVMLAPAALSLLTEVNTALHENSASEYIKSQLTDPNNPQNAPAGLQHFFSDPIGVCRSNNQAEELFTAFENGAAENNRFKSTTFLYYLNPSK